MRRRGARSRRPRLVATRPGKELPTLGRVTTIVLLSACFLALVAFVYGPTFSRVNQTAVGVDEGALRTNNSDLVQASSPTGNLHVPETRFAICGRKPVTCVVDGDTFWLEGEKIRIADINTPEVRSPQCTAERTLGIRATVRLIELLNQGPFELRQSDGDDRDRYGRLLRIVERNGVSLGDQLVAEGLAHVWEGRRLSWCTTTPRSR